MISQLTCSDFCASFTMTVIIGYARLNSVVLSGNREKSIDFDDFDFVIFLLLEKFEDYIREKKYFYKKFPCTLFRRSEHDVLILLTYSALPHRLLYENDLIALTFQLTSHHPFTTFY